MNPKLKNFIFLMVFVFVMLVFIPFVLDTSFRLTRAFKTFFLNNGYDEDLIIYKLWPMASAIYGDNPKLCVNDNFDNAEFKNQYTFRTNSTPKDILGYIPKLEDNLKSAYNCSAFIAASHSDEAIILSFRGSESTFQLLEQGVGAFARHFRHFPAGGNVNLYFSWVYASIWKSGMKNDFLALRRSYPSYEVWVTGHSLGGALASIAAGMISYKNYTPAETIKLITYGQPRVGNSEYVAVMSKLVPNALRIARGYDIVTRIPQEFFGYVHYGTEVRYNETEESYKLYTKDDPVESPSIEFIYYNRYHKNYFGKNNSFAENGCPRSTSKILKKYLKMFLNAIMKLIYWAYFAYGLFVIIRKFSD